MEYPCKKKRIDVFVEYTRDAVNHLVYIEIKMYHPKSEELYCHDFDKLKKLSGVST